jgi:hypothetical protein
LEACLLFYFKNDFLLLFPGCFKTILK